MKKILLFATLFAFAITTSAQERGKEFGQKGMRASDLTPEAIAQKQTEHMKERLGLTPDQEKKIYDLNLKLAKERKARQEVIRSERRQMLSKAKEKDSLVRSILTPDQKRFYYIYRDMQMQKMRDKAKHRKEMMRQNQKPFNRQHMNAERQHMNAERQHMNAERQHMNAERQHMNGQHQEGAPQNAQIPNTQQKQIQKSK